ncbi:hypothetical protein [Saccharothrix syringae]|uniref:hypothetical protein n=1 Tax=Saccharothrix syringae TaxID=103733 RepID=UPI001293C19B|nr:hypothetical protein [Saccharothrix syringae]
MVDDLALLGYPTGSPLNRSFVDLAGHQRPLRAKSTFHDYVVSVHSGTGDADRMSLSPMTSLLDTGRVARADSPSVVVTSVDA